MPWLKEDCIGACSQHVYGRKGDQVTIVELRDDHLTFVASPAERYHIPTDNLSNTPVAPGPKPIEPAMPVRRSGNKKVKRAGSSLF